MTLLKGDSSISKSSELKNVDLSIKDGWNFGIGFGLAMSIAVPLILLFLSCIIGTGLLIFGSSLGALF